MVSMNQSRKKIFTQVRQMQQVLKLGMWTGHPHIRVQTWRTIILWEKQERQCYHTVTKDGSTTATIVTTPAFSKAYLHRLCNKYMREITPQYITQIHSQVTMGGKSISISSMFLSLVLDLASWSRICHCHDQ
eukprot:SAG31_NODE_1305_length_8893_cov_7.391176_6_plen_132_part_00